MSKVIILCFLAELLLEPAFASDKAGKEKITNKQQKLTPTYQGEFDFRGVRLGMTVSEFRALPLPKEVTRYIDASSTARLKYSAQAQCTGDVNAAPEVATSDGHALGVVECAWIVTQHGYPEIRRMSNLDAGDLPVQSYAFRFIATPGESEPRLFEIHMLIQADGYGNLVSLLSEKFGRPSDIRQATVQNRMGATFGRDAALWENRSGQVILRQRYGDVDTGLLQYTLKDHFKYYNDLVQRDKEKDGPKV